MTYPRLRRICCAVLAAALVLTGCGRQVGGVAVAGDTRPHDVWQLADDLVRRSPLNPDAVSKMLGIKLKTNGGGTYRGGPADLGPQLTVSAIRMIDVPAMTAVLVAVKTPDCVRLADVQAHYPQVVKRVAIVQGGRVTEQWVAPYPWGAVGFAIQQPPGCVQTIDVSYAKMKR